MEEGLGKMGSVTYTDRHMDYYLNINIFVREFHELGGLRRDLVTHSF